MPPAPLHRHDAGRHDFRAAEGGPDDPDTVLTKEA
jgi:hypothetical protein